MFDPRQGRSRIRLAATLWCVACVLAAIANSFSQEPVTLEEYTNSIGMKFKRIPPGEFMMGSPEDEPWRSSQETLHRVRITQPFHFGIHEVRRKDFEAFVMDIGYQTDVEKGKATNWYFDEELKESRRDEEKRFSWRNPGFAQTEEHPVVSVTWNDAQEFCKWLSKKEGRRYRLPTEAEWEYACRAGTQTTFPFSDDPTDVEKYANVSDESCWNKLSIGLRAFWDPALFCFPFDDGYSFTAPVGKFLPNKFGLYDMTGNVSEYCQDYRRRDAYEKSPLEDPNFSAEPDPIIKMRYRVMRGGAFQSGPSDAGIASRAAAEEVTAQLVGGFRVAITLDTDDLLEKEE